MRMDEFQEWPFPGACDLWECSSVDCNYWGGGTGLRRECRCLGVGDLCIAPTPSDYLAAYEYYWQCEAAKVRSVDDTTVRSANAFMATSPLSAVVAALPEIDSDMAVAAYKDEATSLNVEAAEDDVLFDDEKDRL